MYYDRDLAFGKTMQCDVYWLGVCKASDRVG